MTQNIVCKIFKEQFDLIKNLPQQERKEVLYLAIENAFNQIENQNDNQIENQNENAYISNSLSNLSISILNILNKTISVKEFSSNYGGNRKNAGRPVNPKKQNDPIKENFNTPIKENFKDNNKIYKESFESFWKEYPKQRAGNKRKAYNAYLRVLKEKRSDESFLLEAVKQYAQSDEVAKGFAKGCEAWLNDDRFNNEYKQKQKWEFF